jgi:hypothetical protein
LAQRKGFLAGAGYNSVGGKRLWEVFEPCADRHGKRLALFLIARAAKWDRLIFLLLSLGEKDESLLVLSRTYLAIWLVRHNRSFSTPTADQPTRLRTILDKQKRLCSETSVGLSVILVNFPAG